MTTPSIVKIESIVRKLRGGSQAHLVKGEDGRYYVAKFLNNPQGNRSLINEWISHRLFLKLGISTPRVRLLNLDNKCAANPILYFSIATRTVPIEPGIHFGSECPVNPDKVAIFDFLPRPLVARISNVSDFGRVLVADRWLCQNDSRQAIFFRERSTGSSLSMRVVFLDNGHLLGGPEWTFHDSELRGFYLDPTVYSTFDLTAICRLTMDTICAITEEEIYACFDHIPETWLRLENTQSVRGLCAALVKRQYRLDYLVERQLEALKMLGPNATGRQGSPVPHTTGSLVRADTPAIPNCSSTDSILRVDTPFTTAS
jgi:HipA-like protein